MIIVTGASGLLGGWLLATLRESGDAFAAPSHEALDITDRDAVIAFARDVKPRAIIHAAAWSAMSDCVRDPERAHLINVIGTANVAEACHEMNARLVHVSTDHVFDGESAPYDESASTSPLSVYGRTKVEAETAALTQQGVSPQKCDVTVVRLSLLFGPTRTKRRGFFDQQLDAFLDGSSKIRLFEDEWRTPLSLRAAAAGLVAIATTRNEVSSILNLGGPERMSRFEMGVKLATILGKDPSAIERSSRKSIPGEPRARDLSLDSTRFRRAFSPIASDDFASECTRMMKP